MDWFIYYASFPNVRDLVFYLLQCEDADNIRAEFKTLGPRLNRLIFEPCREALATAMDLKFQIDTSAIAFSVTSCIYAYMRYDNNFLVNNPEIYKNIVDLWRYMKCKLI